MPEPKFQIDRQGDDDECIPVCAISVLKWYGLPHPKKKELLREMGSQITFHGLARALDNLAEVRVIATSKSDLCDRLMGILAGEKAVLVAVQPPTFDPHCVVVTDCDQHHFTVHDPKFGHRRLAKGWLGRFNCGEMAVIRPLDSMF